MNIDIRSAAEGGIYGETSWAVVSVVVLAVAYDAVDWVAGLAVLEIEVLAVAGDTVDGIAGELTVGVVEVFAAYYAIHSFSRGG